MGIFRDLANSPIARALTLFAAVFVIASFFIRPVRGNDILDSFTIAGGALVVVRFGPRALAGLRTPHPDGPDVLIVSIVGVAVSILLIRILRAVGLEFGLLHSPAVAYLFAAITALMVFSMFLQVVAPPLRQGTVTLTPYFALLLALVAGVLMATIVLILRTLH